MPNPPPPPKRNPLWVWLKTAIQSGALERIPTHYPLEAGGSRDTIDHARELLDALRDPDADRRSLEAIVTDAVRFRRWVESRLRTSRRIILAEGRPGDGAEPESPRRSRQDRERRRVPDAPTSRPVSPRSDPMWDDFLDGLGL